MITSSGQSIPVRGHFDLSILAVSDCRTEDNLLYLPSHGTHNQPGELLEVDILKTKLEYIHQNPVKSGMALSEEEYFVYLEL